jgi:hypothetical protein
MEDIPMELFVSRVNDGLRRASNAAQEGRRNSRKFNPVPLPIGGSAGRERPFTGNMLPWD